MNLYENDSLCTICLLIRSHDKSEIDVSEVNSNVTYGTNHPATGDRVACSKFGHPALSLEIFSQLIADSMTRVVS